MGTQQAGAYLELRRKQMGLSRAKVAKALRTTEKQIERIEGGEIDTRSSLIAGFARLVDANAQRLFSLLLGEPIQETDDLWAEFDRLTPAQQQIVIGLLREFLRGE